MPWPRRPASATRRAAGSRARATLEEAVAHRAARAGRARRIHARLAQPALAAAARLARRCRASSGSTADTSRLPGCAYSAVDLSVFLRRADCARRRPRRRPGRSARSASARRARRPSPIAWRKALAEAFSVHRWVRDRALEQPDARRAPAADDPDVRRPHALLRRTRSAPGGRRSSTPSEARARRRRRRAARRRQRARVDRGASAAALAAHGRRPTPSTSRARTSAAPGCSVVRVAGAGAVPLDVVDGRRFLGGRRMYEAAFEAGLVPRPLGAGGPEPRPASVPVIEPARAAPPDRALGRARVRRAARARRPGRGLPRGVEGLTDPDRAADRGRAAPRGEPGSPAQLDARSQAARRCPASSCQRRGARAARSGRRSPTRRSHRALRRGDAIGSSELAALSMPATE